MPTGMVSQNLINLESASLSSGKKGTSVKSDKLKGSNSLFRQLINEKGNKGKDTTKLVNFKKLLNLLNLSDKELKAKLQGMDQDKLKDLKNMVEFVFMNLLKRIHQLKQGSKNGFSSLKGQKLHKLTNRLGDLQKLINKMTGKSQVIKGNNTFSPENGSPKVNNQTNKTQSKTQTKGKTSNNKKGNLKSNTLSSKTGENLQANNSEKNSVKIAGMSGKRTGDISLSEKGTKQFKLSALNQSTNNEDNLQKISRNLQKNIKQSLQQISEQNSNKSSNGGKAGDLLLNKLQNEFKLKNSNNNLNGLDLKKGLNQSLNLSTSKSGSNNDSQFNHNFNQQNQGQFSWSFSNNNSQVNSTSNGALTRGEMASIVQNKPVNQISEQIKLLHKPAQNEVKMQLEPEFLGKVKLNLKVESGKVTAKFLVDNMLVKNNLDQNLAVLRSNLVNQGFNVDQIEVESDNSRFDMNQEGQSDQQFTSEDQNQKQNKQGYRYENGYFIDMSPEKLEEIIQEGPENLSQMGILNQKWMTLDGQYQRMNILA